MLSLAAALLERGLSLRRRHVTAAAIRAQPDLRQQPRGASCAGWLKTEAQTSRHTTRKAVKSSAYRRQDRLGAEMPESIGPWGLFEDFELVGWVLGRFPHLVAAGPEGPRKAMKIVGSAEWRRGECTAWPRCPALASVPRSRPGRFLHQGIRYEERGAAVSVEAKKVRTRQMIRELRTLGYHVEQSPAPSSNPARAERISTLAHPCRMISRTLSREKVASLEVIERRRVVLLGQRDQILPASALRLHEHVASNASAVKYPESSGARCYGADRSAEFLGESDEKPLRPADVESRYASFTGPLRLRAAHRACGAFPACRRCRPRRT